MGIKYEKLRLNQSIGGLFGTSGGAAGTGFRAPAQAAGLTPTTDGGQLNASYLQSKGAINNQDALLQALQAQRGMQQQQNAAGMQDTLAWQQARLGSADNQYAALQQQLGLNSQLSGLNGAANQNAVFGQGQQLANAMAGANGVGNLSGALASQQALAQRQQALAEQQQGLVGQYQDIAAGRGPNPAMAMLNQQTGQNVANQAALMAGQRGAGANVGLMARQAAQQGAATQQQAVGQGATMQAQQQLNALGAIGAQQQAIGNTTANIGNTNSNVANIAAQQIAQQQAQQQALAGMSQAQVAQQQAAINAAQQAASGMTAQQMAQQQALAGTANTIAGQQIGQTNANVSSNFQQQAAQQQAAQAMNANQVAMQSNINSANAGLAGETIKGQSGVAGGLLSGAASGLAALAKGGEVQKMADGGPTEPMPAAPPVPNAVAAPGMDQQGGAQSSYGKFMQGMGSGMAQNQDPLQKGTADMTKSLIGLLKSKPSAAAGGSGFAGADASAMAATPVVMASKGGDAMHDYRGGGHVKAKDAKEKAVKKGDSYDNDKIPAMLSEHEIVIPRHVTQGKDPVKGAADFVAKVLAKRKRA